MSIAESRGSTSILKTHSSLTRDKIKESLGKKIRFQLPIDLCLTKVLEETISNQNFKEYDHFLICLKENDLESKDYLKLIKESRRSISLLKPSFTSYIDCILKLDWFHQEQEIIDEFKLFLVDLLSAHNKYSNLVIPYLISKCVPKEDEFCDWELGCPSNKNQIICDYVHEIIDNLFAVVPMTFDTIIDTMEHLFPYYRKSTHIIAGFCHCIIQLMEKRPIFKRSLTQLVLNKLLILDVNAPRNEIEDAEEEELDEDIDESPDAEKIQKEDNEHPIAQSLDVCMDKIFNFIKNCECSDENQRNEEKIFKVLMSVFENSILPSHNTHHIQFVIFYFCSFKPLYYESFLKILWEKVCNPNVPATIRTASIGYIASLLARAKYIPLYTLQSILDKMCGWAHQYIQKSDSMRNNTLKAHTVFYSVCQAIFYVIAFRSKNLTNGPKNLIFLQSLQLSSIVTSYLNPLRVCLPAVATAFAGVTRAHQLAYCHTILERNARKKLATIYQNDSEMPEDCLETFFPFDPYLLKRSGSKINSIYLHYQPDAEEEAKHEMTTRKRTYSIASDDVDDFIMEKKMKESADKNLDRFSYGIIPGFHH